MYICVYTNCACNNADNNNSNNRIYIYIYTHIYIADTFISQARINRCAYNVRVCVVYAYTWYIYLSICLFTYVQNLYGIFLSIKTGQLNFAKQCRCFFGRLGHACGVLGLHAATLPNPFPKTHTSIRQRHSHRWKRTRQHLTLSLRWYPPQNCCCTRPMHDRRAG